MTTLLTRPGQSPPGHGSDLPPAPDRRGSANLTVGAATAAAVLLASLSVHGVIEGWSWFLPLFLAVLLPLAATAGARRLGFPLPLIPLAGIAALACVLTWLFASSAALLGFLPGPAAFARADALLVEARTVIITEVTPVQSLPGIVFLCCAGIGLVAVLADTLASTLRMPATAGLGLLAVVMLPAVLKPQSIGAWSFLLAAAGYLLLLAAGSRREQQGPGTPLTRAWLGRSAAVSAAALTAALLLPAVMPGFTAGAFPEGSKFNFWSGGTGLNPIVTLGNDLRQPQSAGRITYATSAEDPLYLRSTTLEDFSGRRWSPDLRRDERLDGVASMTRSADDAPGTAGTPVVTRISSTSYASPWLLAPYYPLSVSGANGEWSWDPKTMTVLDKGSNSAPGQDYQVLSVAAQVTPEQLAASPATLPESMDPVFTDLPEDVPAAIGEASADAVGNAATPYAKAMAIQNYLRGPQFTYSLDAPVEGGYDGNGMDVLAEFLDRKAGYCIHFAAAMTVMARQEGIPSRMALGYAPGQATGEAPDGTGPNGEALREFEVDSTDAHAWPELYFEGAGWVRFEPTPSRGSVPDYAQQPRTPAGATLRDDDDPRVPAAAPPAAPAVPGPEPLEPETVLEPDSSGGPAWAGLVLGTLAAAAAVLAPWSLRRARTARRREAARSAGLISPVWDETADLGFDYGFPGKPSDTPRAYARRLAAGAGFAPPVREALDRVCRAYEQEVYARAGAGPAPEPERSAGAGALWPDVETVRAELQATARPSARLRARLLPASLATRFRHG